MIGPLPEAARPSGAPPNDVVVVSNGGPLNFALGADGWPMVERAAGALVVALGPGVATSGALWVAAALSDTDRVAAGDAGAVIEAQGFRVRSLAIDPADFSAYYGVVANGTLWYLNHGLWDLTRSPRFDRHWHQAWASYRRVNQRFAEAVCQVADPRATVIVQDYHLALVAGMVRARRDDLRTATFIHTPWCTPEELAVLPDDVSDELMATMVAGGPCGFHSPRWAQRYRACAMEVTGGDGPAFVAPAAPDVDDLTVIAASEACGDALAALDAAVGGRRLIVRVDRIEPSKNVLRGLWAFDAMLEAHLELVDEVVFAVYLYPSRLGLADYQAYAREITTLVSYLNDKWGRPGWVPIDLDVADDYPRSVAALRRYDVLVVNPVRDGLNLVAIEGPAVNDRDGMVVLSRHAGCFDLLGDHVFAINPFDVAATADALAAALHLPAPLRAQRAAALRAAGAQLSPQQWWSRLVAAASGHDWPGGGLGSQDSGA